MFHSNSAVFVSSLLSPFCITVELLHSVFFHAVYLSRSHPCCLKNFNKSYKSTVSTYLEIASWPYSSSFSHEYLVWLWVMVCFKQAYYINRSCPGTQWGQELPGSVSPSTAWFSSSRVVIRKLPPPFLKLSCFSCGLIILFFMKKLWCSKKSINFDSRHIYFTISAHGNILLRIALFFFSLCTMPLWTILNLNPIIRDFV